MINLSISNSYTTTDAIGRIVSICIRRHTYMTYSVQDIERLMLPPIQHRQYYIFQHDGKDVGFFTWARLSQHASEFILQYAADPRPYEWQSGPYLWIMDMVAEENFGIQIALDIQRKIFTHEFTKINSIDTTVKVKALRRNADNTIRKVSLFNFKQ